MSVIIKYLGDKNWGKDFPDSSKKFFHEHLGLFMFITGIGDLNEESLDEFLFRVNHLRLMETKLTDEHKDFFSSFIPTKINGATITRLQYLRQKYRDEIAVYNSQWVKKVEKAKYYKQTIK
jgi:hypothetical protein